MTIDNQTVAIIVSGIFAIITGGGWGARMINNAINRRKRLEEEVTKLQQHVAEQDALLTKMKNAIDIAIQFIPEKDAEVLIKIKKIFDENEREGL